MSRCNGFPIFSRRTCYTPYNIQGLHLFRITQKPNTPKGFNLIFFQLCHMTQKRNKPKTNKKLKPTNPKHLLLSVSARNQFFLKTWEHAKYYHWGLQAPRIRCCTFRVKLGSVVCWGFFCRFGFLLLLGFVGFFFINPHILKAIDFPWNQIEAQIKYMLLYIKPRELVFNLCIHSWFEYITHTARSRDTCKWPGIDGSHRCIPSCNC